MDIMSNTTYESFKKRVWSMVYDYDCTKEELQSFYDSEIKYRYSDWYDSLVMIDHVQSKWTMNLR